MIELKQIWYYVFSFLGGIVLCAFVCGFILRNAESESTRAIQNSEYRRTIAKESGRRAEESNKLIISELESTRSKLNSLEEETGILRNSVEKLRIENRGLIKESDRLRNIVTNSLKGVGKLEATNNDIESILNRLTETIGILERIYKEYGLTE